MSDSKNPTPLYALRQGKINGLPAFMLVNVALKNFKFKSSYPWCLDIFIKMRDTKAQRLPTGAETKVLDQLEHQIEASIGRVCHKQYIGRTTCDGRRELFFYVDAPQKVEQQLHRLAVVNPPLREFFYNHRRRQAMENSGRFLQLRRKDALKRNCSNVRFSLNRVHSIKLLCLSVYSSSISDSKA